MAEIRPEYFCELPRHRRLAQFRKYLDSKQYDGRADFFTGLKPGDPKPVPLRERKPCIIYPLPRSAANQVVRFTFGESRFPTINVEEIDSDSSVAGETLSKDEAETLETFISSLVEYCNIKPAMRRFMRAGLAVGTTCAILSLKRGVIDLQLANAEDVLVTFQDGDPTSEPKLAVWAYQYTDSVPDAQGHPQPKSFWFRQDISESEFIEYERVEAKSGERPQWRVSRVVPHGFGFCPVIWGRNVIDADSRDVDGVSLFDNLLEEFDALNFALSQRHRGINFWGVPQPWETGVEEDDGPQADGRRSRGGYSPAGVDPPHGKVEILGADGRPAVRVSPDNKWSYRNENSKVGLLETTGKAFEAGTNHVNDIRSRALEAMSVVLVNVSEVMNRTAQNQMSAKFLELAYEPLLALVDEMRHCWWPFGLKAILSAALRIVAVRKGEGLYIPGAKKASKILERFFVTVTGADGKETNLWMAPRMTPAWGDYFSAGPEEIEKAVETATKAKDANLIPAEDASKAVLPYYGRDDTQEALAEIEADKEAAQAQAQLDAENEAKKLHDMAKRMNSEEEPEEPSEDHAAASASGRGSGEEPTQATRGRRRRGPAAAPKA